MPQRTFSCSRSTSGSEQLNVPVRRRSVCTTTASSASGVSSPGQPLTSAYRKPWKVNRGSQVRGPLPSRTTTSVASAARSGRVPSSPCSSTSACRTVISVPAGASGSENRIRPTRFCPKSTSVAPDGDVEISRTGSVSVRRTGGPVGATSVPTSSDPASTGAQSASGRPADDQPGTARRASNVSPLYSPARVSGLGADRHESSVVTVVREPSGCSTSSCTNAPVRSPYQFRLPVKPR